MEISEDQRERLEMLLHKELSDKTLVEQILELINSYYQPQDDEAHVIWESEWCNTNQVKPWLAKIQAKGRETKRVFLDCVSEYNASDRKLVKKSFEGVLNVGTIVEYVTAGNSKRSLQYYGVITKYGLYQIGEVEDNTTITEFLKNYSEEYLAEITSEHQMDGSTELFAP